MLKNISGYIVGCHLAGLILPVNQANDDLDHRVHLVRVALRNHQRQRHKGSVGYALCSVSSVQDAVVLHKPKEEGSCDSFVPVHEGVVLDDQV